METVYGKKDRDLLIEISKNIMVINNRLDGHDKRFDQVDKRFDQVDKRFDQLESEFVTARSEMNSMQMAILCNGREIRNVRSDLADMNQKFGSIIANHELRIQKLETIKK